MVKWHWKCGIRGYSDRGFESLSLRKPLWNNDITWGPYVERDFT